MANGLGTVVGRFGILPAENARKVAKGRKRAVRRRIRKMPIRRHRTGQPEPARVKDFTRDVGAERCTRTVERPLKEFLLCLRRTYHVYFRWRPLNLLVLLIRSHTHSLSLS
jgi:hypothetical protein